MSAPEEVSENDQPQDSAPAIQEVSGGHHGKTYLGGQYGQYIGTQVNKTFNPVGASAKPQKPGQFQVSSLITVFEKDPISLSSRIFKGSLHSDVTGDRDAAIKITAAQKQNYREAKIYFSVPHHKNIVERFATDTFNFRGQPSIFIAMERCDCNLYNHVLSEVRDGVEFDAEKYTSIAYQILVGLDFLHSHNVVHGDFKPANVLLILNGNIVKLTDFGLSRAITQGNTSTQLTSPQGGTTGWQAPEILEGTMRISIASDIFPCGLTLHFVWSHGKHAYGDKTVSLNHYIVEDINLDLGRMLIPFVDDAKVLLEKMLQRDRTDRPSVQEILQSRIFSHFGPQPVRADDAQVVELFDRALSFTNPEAAHLSEDPLPISARQLQTAMQSFLERNQMKLTREPAIPQPVADDEQVDELFDRALRFANPRGAEAANLSEDPLTLRISARQLQTAMQSFLERNQMELTKKPPGTRPTRVVDAQVAEVVDQALSFLNTQGPPASNVNEDDITPLGAAIGQLQTAMRSFLERSQMQMTTISPSGSCQTSPGSTSPSLPVEEPRSASRLSSQSSLLSGFIDTENAPSMDAPASHAFEEQSEATNPKQLFVGSQDSTNDDPDTTSHQSRNTDLHRGSFAASGSCQTSSASTSLSLPVEEPSSASRSTSQSSLLSGFVDTEVAPSMDAPASHAFDEQFEATNPKQLVVGSQDSTNDDPDTTSHQSRNTDSHRGSFAASVSRSMLHRLGLALGISSPQIEAAKQVCPSIPLSGSRNGGPREWEATGSSGPSWSRHGCDVIFMSPHSWDESLLRPFLLSQIYGTSSPNGKEEFVQCDEESSPETIQEFIANMRVCDEGITTIIVAYWRATVPLVRAFEANNLRRFLQNKGLFGEALKQKMRNTKRNLAIFTFESRKYISQDSSKIAVNINLSKDESDGKLKTVTIKNGKVVKKITFQGTWSALLFPVAEDFIKNEKVMAFIRGTLQ